MRLRVLPGLRLRPRVDGLREQSTLCPWQVFLSQQSRGGASPPEGHESDGGWGLSAAEVPVGTLRLLSVPRQTRFFTGKIPTWSVSRIA